MLAQLTATAEEQRAVADTRELRHAAFREHLAAASELLASRDLEGAAARIAQAIELRPTIPRRAGSRRASPVRSSSEAARRPIAPVPAAPPADRAPAGKTDTRRTKTAGRRKRPAADDESDLLKE
jgi:hypothetical protein